TYSSALTQNIDSKLFLPICFSCYVNEECPNKDNCIYAHGDECPHCTLNLLHPYNKFKRKEHLNVCSKYFDTKNEYTIKTEQSESKVCGICYEKIFGQKQFGLLNGCQHSFCLECIVEWRNQKEEVYETNCRSCPMCRTVSNYVIPSKYFFEDLSEKEKFDIEHRAKLKEQHCRYFKFGFGMCKFGRNCFFRHEIRASIIDSSDPYNFSDSEFLEGYKDNRS
ncbi:MAG: E3 ubiquitin-protein ligase makorin-1, partial [Paramarteilia canceri]